MRSYTSAIALIFFITVIANGENSVVLTQKASPLRITKYEAKYQEEYRGSYSSHPDQIRHQVSSQNVSGRVVVAFQIGLVALMPSII